MSWIFHPSDPMGGAAGEAYANTLKSPGMHHEHVLARESIQNSVDAGMGDKKVRVCFRESALTGAKKKVFVEAAGLEDIAARAAVLELTPNCLASLDKASKPLKLLYVEDYNAEGLSGDPHDKGSNFHRLLLSLGDRSKARVSKGSGGSYGFGKSVYSSSSAMQTIFAYTRFKTGEGDTESTRIFGCGYYASHEFGGEMFSGRAWHGSAQHNDALGRTVIDPLQGDVADALAIKLGFVVRGQGECGTSIMIVDADINIALIVQGVEDWWWPRLVDNKLDVEIYDAAGEKFLPRPKKRPELKPFIDAFDIAKKRAEPKAGTQEFFSPNKESGYDLGTCGCVIVPVNAHGATVVPAERCNTVALIRAPLMVVAYKSISESSPPVVGAYVAAETEIVDLALKKSEPPAHDRWDPESTNLREEGGLGRKLVEAILSRIKGGMRRFQQRAAPPAPAKQRRLNQLERALGSYFKPQGLGGGVPPDSGPSPLHLEFTKQPFAEATPEGMLVIKSVFTLKLDDQSDQDDVVLRMRINCPVLEDDNEEGDDLKISVVVGGVTATADAVDPHIYRFTLPKNTKAKFSIESESYDPAWTVRLRPDIEKEEFK